jgi:peptide/nickel transport system substrate-binding protein
MQSNPILTVLKILAFAVLAFVVGVSSCQKDNLEAKVSALDQTVASLSKDVQDVRRTLERGGGRAGSAVDTRPQRPSRAALDASIDPARPVGTPGRYKDFLSEDPDPEVPPEAAAHTEGELSIWFGPEPKGFNFVTENDAGITNYVEQYVSDAPAGRHWRDPSRWKPGVAWRIEVSPDFREYTMFLRDDVRWHRPKVDLRRYKHLDGDHFVTAADIKFTLDIIRNPQTDCAPLRGYYTDVEEVRVIDPHTVVVRWAKAMHHSIAFTVGLGLMPEFLYAFDENGERYPEATIGQSFNNHWFNRVGFCGCGPYEFAQYESGQRIVLDRFDDWYGANDGLKYAIRRLKLLIFPDGVTNEIKITAGEIRVGALNAPQWKNNILDNKDPNSPYVDGRILHKVTKGADYAYFGWKNSHPLFRDRNVRRALALACNREQICRDIFLGRFTPMASPVYPESPEADPDVKPLPFDLAESKRLLDGAGWALNPATGLREKVVDGERKTFEFTLLWPGPSPDFEAALNQYKNDLLSVGVKMNPQSMEWAAYQKKLQDREFEACSLLWATNGWEHDFDQIWHSRGIQDPNSSNHIEFKNDEVDRLSDELRVTMDPAKRVAMVRRIGRLLYEEQPYCFFGWRNAFTVWWSDVKNVTEHEYKMRPFRRFFPMYVTSR